MVVGELATSQLCSLLICSPLLSVPLLIPEKQLLALEKEGSSWLQRDICSEGVDCYKHFYVRTLMREELGKRDPKRQREKKVARN